MVPDSEAPVAQDGGARAYKIRAENTLGALLLCRLKVDRRRRRGT